MRPAKRSATTTALDGQLARQLRLGKAGTPQHLVERQHRGGRRLRGPVVRLLREHRRLNPAARPGQHVVVQAAGRLDGVGQHGQTHGRVLADILRETRVKSSPALHVGAGWNVAFLVECDQHFVSFLLIVFHHEIPIFLANCFWTAATLEAAVSGLIPRMLAIDGPFLLVQGTPSMWSRNAARFPSSRMLATMRCT